MAFTTHPTGTLKQYSYPEFELRGSFGLGGPAYQLAVDGTSGTLFAVVAEPGTLRFLHVSHEPKGVGNLHVYDVSPILQGKSGAGSELSPAAEIALGGNVAQMVASPDFKWLFCLVNQPNSGGNQRLVRIDAQARKADMELDLAAGTTAFCLTRDGKTLYAAASSRASGTIPRGPRQGQIQVIDPATLEVRRVVTVEADPSDIEATSGGLVFLSSSAPSEVAVVEMKKTRSVVARWRGIFGGMCIRLAPDQKRLYVATRGISPASVVSWLIPERLASKPIETGKISDGANTPLGGEIFLTPDGHYLLTRAGAVVPLGARRGGSPGKKGSPSAPPPAKPRRLGGS